jgi:hydrogenase 3 maturation protease
MQIRGDCQELAVGDDPTVSLREALAHLGGSRVVILGVGNVLKGDDAAGPMVCQGVAGWLSVKVIDTGTVPENDLGPILRHAPENVLIVDAKDLGSPVGTIRVLPRTSVVSLGSSTHSLSPRLLADAMAQGISGEVTFLGIQLGHVRLGHPVSAEVGRAVERAPSVLLELFPSDSRSL